MLVGIGITLNLWNHNIREFQAPESLTYKTLIFQFIQDKNQHHPTPRGGVEYHE